MTGKIIFGAGCFWGVQYYFDQVPGVLRTTAGYSGGHTADPDYYSIHEAETGHAEVVLVEFDPDVVPFEVLVRHFFRMHDPTLHNSDGINFGSTYRSVLYYFDDEQLAIVGRIKVEAQRMYTDPIVTEIAPAGAFYEAEPFHQKFTERTGHGTCHVPYEAIEGELQSAPDHTDTMAKLRGWLTGNSR